MWECTRRSAESLAWMDQLHWMEARGREMGVSSSREMHSDPKPRTGTVLFVNQQQGIFSVRVVYKGLDSLLQPSERRASAFSPFFAEGMAQKALESCAAHAVLPGGGISVLSSYWSLHKVRKRERFWKKFVKPYHSTSVIPPICSYHQCHPCHQ